jgi:hypothetical protein
MPHWSELGHQVGPPAVPNKRSLVLEFAPSPDDCASCIRESRLPLPATAEHIIGEIRLAPTALPAMKPRRVSACRTACPIRLHIWPQTASREEALVNSVDQRARQVAMAGEANLTPLSERRGEPADSQIGVFAPRGPADAVPAYPLEQGTNGPGSDAARGPSLALFRHAEHDGR